jgi:hypothetical protein
MRAAAVKPGFQSIPIGYIATRSREDNAKKKRDAVFAKTVDKFDRKREQSIPGRVDVREEAGIRDAVSIKAFQKLVETYRDARFEVDAENRKYQIIKMVAGMAGMGVALAASFLTGGGLVFLGISVAVGIGGYIANKLIDKKIKDPRSIEELAKHDPKVGELLKTLDRKGVSVPHWVDKAEYDKLSPTDKKKYNKVLKEILKHNKDYKNKSLVLDAAAKVASYSSTILPMFFNLPGTAVKLGITGSVMAAGFVSNYLKGKMVPLKDANGKGGVAASALPIPITTTIKAYAKKFLGL